MIDISSLTNIAELQLLCDRQQKALLKAQERIKLLEGEVEQLKSPQLSAAPSVQVISDQDEEVICRIQIAMLRTKAQEREMTLEETKRFDLLVKNLSLIEERKIANAKEVPSLEVSDAQLLALAGDLNGSSG